MNCELNDDEETYYEVFYADGKFRTGVWSDSDRDGSIGTHLFSDKQDAAALRDRLNSALRPVSKKASDPSQIQGRPPIGQRIEEVQLTFRAIGLTATKEVAHKFILTLGHIARDGDISIKKLAEIDERLDEIYKEEEL